MHIHNVFQSASLVPSQNLFQSYHQSQSYILQRKGHSCEPAGKEGVRREGLGDASHFLSIVPCYFLSPSPPKMYLKLPSPEKHAYLRCITYLVQPQAEQTTDKVARHFAKGQWKISLIPPCPSVSSLLVKINLSPPRMMDISSC